MLLTIILVGFGILMVFSSSEASASWKFNSYMYFMERQVIWGLVGMFTMLIVMNIPYQIFQKWSRPIFVLILILLGLVIMFGTKINGHRSWFGVGSFGIQPTEFAKIGLIIYLAALINKKGENIRQFKKGLLPLFIIVGLVLGLIMLQPDIGSDLVILIAATIVIVVGGANLLQLFGIGLVLLPIAIGIVLAKSYRLQRFTAYLHPWNDSQDSSYQLVQSLLALGHGGWTGAGLGKGVEKMLYLPEAHTDFIFATIGEEFGFIGSFIFLIMYILFIWRCIVVALRCPDLFGTLIGIGIVSLIGVQALINLGGVTGSIPITGVPLPLISYGGSSLLITMASVGILLNISRKGRASHDQRATA
ncbi:putative lipid II flippase FtsW [Paenibacillus aestuarii]|uniref:Probable peptidoglycan glycosyltransferase FtsW n=1 Tax=Paenibacillus aestuarii TaxID=516965 RepID=A0ABW0KGP9_9BACL|nr:putative lipid II flippase FtsW [Paenibacillus aestuarii]